MRRHHLIAAGISVTLLVGGAASAALADPPPAGRIKGEGRSAKAARFTVQVRQDKLEKGHLIYRSADGRFRVSCDGFKTYSPRVYVAPGPPAAVVTAECDLKGPRRQRTRINVEAEFVDASSFERGADDEVNLTFTSPDGTQVTDSGRILSGYVRVR